MSSKWNDVGVVDDSIAKGISEVIAGVVVDMEFLRRRGVDDGGVSIVFFFVFSLRLWLSGFVCKYEVQSNH